MIETEESSCLSECEEAGGRDDRVTPGSEKSRCVKKTIEPFMTVFNWNRPYHEKICVVVCVFSRLHV